MPLEAQRLDQTRPSNISLPPRSLFIVVRSYSQPILRLGGLRSVLPKMYNFYARFIEYKCVDPVVLLNVGNTQVTCHMGVPSCGQRHRNVFIDLLLTCTITNTIINDSLASPPASSHRHHEPVTRPHVCAQAQNPT